MPLQLDSRLVNPLYIVQKWFLCNLIKWYQSYVGNSISVLLLGTLWLSLVARLSTGDLVVE